MPHLTHPTDAIPLLALFLFAVWLFLLITGVSQGTRKDPAPVTISIKLTAQEVKEAILGYVRARSQFDAKLVSGLTVGDVTVLDADDNDQDDDFSAEVTLDTQK